MVLYKYIIALLILICFLVWFSVFSVGSYVQVIACDVGQGDAVLIQYKSDQILIDGGPDSSVLSCLGRYMPFWDRKIELIVNTHPESDHASGLIDVLDAYDVEMILINDLSMPIFSGQIVEVLRNKVGSEGADILMASRSQRLRLGLIYLDILWPKATTQNSNLKTQNLNANDMSVVLLLKYAQFDALFTGDIEDKVSDQLSINTELKDIEYIKIPHHGSKNGISESLFDAVDPEVAVISVGAKNSYGHPHEEVLQLLSNQETKILRTDQLGDVVIETDGEKYWVRD